MNRHGFLTYYNELIWFFAGITKPFTTDPPPLAGESMCSFHSIGEVENPDGQEVVPQNTAVFKLVQNGLFKEAKMLLDTINFQSK